MQMKQTAQRSAHCYRHQPSVRLNKFSQACSLLARPAVMHNEPDTVPDGTAPHSSSSSSSSVGVKVTALDNFSAMCTMLGGIHSSSYRGYVGTWTSFDIPDHGPSTDADASTAASKQAASQDPAAAAAAAPRIQPVPKDEAVNFRLFRMEDPATSTVHQVNMYQNGGRPAAAGYRPYMSCDATNAGRPDGYAVREWRHDPTGALWNPDGSRWRALNSAVPAEQALLGIAVPNCSMALINGALSGSFEPDHQPASWHMEVMFQQPGSCARRWGILQRYDAGCLVNVKAINEDHTELQAEELHSRVIDPSAIPWQPRTQGSVGDVDAFAQLHVRPHGTATVFTYDEHHRLTVQTAECTWTNRHVLRMQQAAAAATAHAANVQQVPAVCQVDLPDCSYCRVPVCMADLVSHIAAGDREGPATTTATAAAAAAVAEAEAETALVDAGVMMVTFELGTVMSDGSLARWLLEYAASGSRLLQKATYELYPAALKLLDACA